jgi:hypothetical protein
MGASTIVMSRDIHRPPGYVDDQNGEILKFIAIIFGVDLLFFGIVRLVSSTPSADNRPRSD